MYIECKQSLHVKLWQKYDVSFSQIIANFSCISISERIRQEHLLVQIQR